MVVLFDLRHLEVSPVLAALDPSVRKDPRGVSSMSCWSFRHPSPSNHRPHPPPLARKNLDCGPEPDLGRDSLE